MSKKNKYSWPIIGHEQNLKYLQRCIDKGTIAHAYLFYGPHHLGKFLVAWHVASAIQCQSEGDAKPCLRCPACLQLEKNIHPDITIVKRDNDKQAITIDQVRDLQHKLSLRSFLTNYKIAIIDGAEGLTEEAANALLKTLEEPTGRTIFFLLCENKDALPKTIISRCQLILFNLVPREIITSWLQTISEDASKNRLLAHLAQGRPGFARMLLANPTLVEQHAERVHQFLQFTKSDCNSKITGIRDLLRPSQEATESTMAMSIVEGWLSVLRDTLLESAGVRTQTNINFQSTIRQLAATWGVTKTAGLISEGLLTLKRLKTPVNPRVLIENFLLSM